MENKTLISKDDLNIHVVVVKMLVNGNSQSQSFSNPDNQITLSYIINMAFWLIELNKLKHCFHYCDHASLMHLWIHIALV